MIRVEDIEQAVKGLSPSQLREFRAWFAEHDAAEWDKQLESDAAAGRLDALSDEARDNPPDRP